MHPIMQALHEDHVNVVRLLDLIEGALEQAGLGDPSRLGLAHQAMRYMTTYPDIFHHPTEDVVFAALVRRAPETKKTVDRLSAEHTLLGRSGADFLHLLKDTGEDPLPVVDTGTTYIATLREHMNVEEGKVFPIIKVVLGWNDWEALADCLESARDPLFGPQLKNSYQELARALAQF